ncbi:ABC transporter permease [Sphaerisporangium krabiense]|uniref:Putative ABC transport system permease protein n=1 Tax=Sphaerisporangium krabiense TaxID=763782 RepID=A0A7W9DT01_9ACTN|nr:ABC transporter permease [Sphaerisporangium krabiense]MBB5630111.1 putative ABC transport system permease protein [Sphaerisporangium krabiense]GII65059.1 ABC transporter permease [Sphaerisporangium krabiense]
MIAGRAGVDGPRVPSSRMRAADLLPTGTLGLRARRPRALLSALGIAIGIAAIVAVLGVTRSSQAALLEQIDRLGTNLLTVANGKDLGGAETMLPADATRMIRRVEGVTGVAPTAQLLGRNVYRTDRVPSGQTGGLALRACDAALPATLDGHIRQGRFLDAATGAYPVAVLGYEAARTLGITRVDAQTRIWAGGHWFTVAGILDPLTLAPEIDRSALIGFPVAARLLGYEGQPTRLYVRAAQDQVDAVAGLLGATANPAGPETVAVTRPSDALTARVAVAESSAVLFLGLGAIALLVGGIGIGNIMVISVLERRGEIGLRRALGAAPRHVAGQFLTESLTLAAFGGAGGVALGCAVTLALARARGWTVLIPVEALWGGVAVAIVVGALAGLYPALRAARLSPTDALRTA